MSFIFIGASHGPKSLTALHTAELKRHALTLASTGSGKGACQILPTCILWDGSLVVVDPKGEAAEFTVRNKAQLDPSRIAVLDPFNYADLPTATPQMTAYEQLAQGYVEDYRVRFNPLDLVEDEDDLRMIANGMIMRTGSESDPFWKDSSEAIIAGFLAFIAGTCGDEDRHLGTVIDLIRSLENDAERDATLALMRECEGFGGISIDAANRLSKGGNTIGSILETLKTELLWLTSPKIRHFLRGGDDLDLHQLKTGRLKLFLVIPPDKLDGYGTFLRLFVRCALSVMWRKTGSAQKGTSCLFLLDEFAALGKISEIRTSALQQGRSFGLHVWPFVLSWTQLVDLYGRDGAEDFIGATDVFSAYGVQDTETAELISRRIGNTTSADVAGQLMAVAGQIERDERNREAVRVAVHTQKVVTHARKMEAFNERKGHAEQSARNLRLRHPNFKERPPDPVGPVESGGRPHALYAKQNELQARIGRPRMSADAIRLKTAQGEVSPGVVMAKEMYVEQPGRSDWLQPWAHFWHLWEEPQKPNNLTPWQSFKWGWSKPSSALSADTLAQRLASWWR